jgi:hypothetical protein
MMQQFALSSGGVQMPTIKSIRDQITATAMGMVE